MLSKKINPIEKRFYKKFLDMSSLFGKDLYLSDSDFYIRIKEDSVFLYYVLNPKFKYKLTFKKGKTEKQYLEEAEALYILRNLEGSKPLKINTKNRINRY